jgi:hypothetical protein
MTTLADINNSIQEMVQNQESTNDSLQSLVSKIAAEGEAAERQRLKDAANRSQSKSVSTRSQPAPTSIAQGLGQGTGLSGMGEILGSMLKGVGFGGGLLGGATLGGLFGKAVGRLFFPAVGAFFGAQYLDKWIDPLVDRITGDDATWTMFGKEVDASKIVSGFAGAMAIIFGKDAIIQTAKGMLGVGSDTKVGAMRKMFVRRFGLPAIAMALSGTIGAALEEASGGMVTKDVTSTVIDGVSLAMMFMPGGLIVKALAGFALSGGMLIRDYLRDRAEKAKAEFLAEVDAFAKEQELHKQSDAMLIAKANEIAQDVGTKEYYGRGTATFSAVEQEAYLRELEKRDPKAAELALVREEIAYQLAELENARMMGGASLEHQVSA